MPNELSMDEYLELIQLMDPDSASEIEKLKSDSPLDFNPATMTNWTRSALDHVTQTGNKDMIARLSYMHDRAKDETNLDDISKEISGLYSCAFEFKKAELNLEVISKVSNNMFDEESISKTESSLISISSSIKSAIVRAFGMLTRTTKYFDKIITDLKGIFKDISTKSKARFIQLFSNVAKYFFQLINEFAGKIFSFIEIINQLGISKGFGLKSTNISFVPPTFTNLSIFGFPIPVPTITLPKVDMNFELQKNNLQSVDYNRQDEVTQSDHVPSYVTDIQKEKKSYGIDLGQLTGYYTYRSFLNNPTPVNDFNRIKYAEAELFLVMKFDGTFKGTLSYPADSNAKEKLSMDIVEGRTLFEKSGTILEFTTKGRPNTLLSDHEYKYSCTVTHSWENGLEQLLCLTGTVLRTKDHGTGDQISKAGLTASFVAVKRESQNQEI